MDKMKILRPAICLLLCVAAIIICLGAAGKFKQVEEDASKTTGKTISTSGSYIYTDYAYYGGDAYTGIQQAGADTANNVAAMGQNMMSAANSLYAAQRNAANNTAVVAAGIAAIGSMLSTAVALAFAVLGIKYLFDVLQILREKKAVPQKWAVQPAVAPVAAPQSEIPDSGSEEI